MKQVSIEHVATCTFMGMQPGNFLFLRYHLFFFLTFIDTQYPLRDNAEISKKAIFNKK